MQYLGRDFFLAGGGTINANRCVRTQEIHELSNLSCFCPKFLLFVLGLNTGAFSM